MSDSRRRVVITGLGAITPVGNDVPATWGQLLAGGSGAAPITIFEATREFTSRIACEVKDFDPLNFL
ncbi:MAG TPA: beta-ketoacyl-[acyl-carrier-protein] synthase II, partial [Gemmatimonadetes bacterium]|nr:beta-ketoacyl-[acyl-carrier-protein] synthase II [Gemmatimonadota bacterium]